ncbi:hypothetical protein EVAR_37306_1 [Eumeta japonica]|uniref:Uncharacterized protein n=1 Tax=Eumeta variegata TaxID=151549 RepID=A0A4C1WZU1_EUMVA|nr:hypothetical protein EVAR_37306_1 [Eumeta japonica]
MDDKYISQGVLSSPNPTAAGPDAESAALSGIIEPQTQQYREVTISMFLSFYELASEKRTVRNKVEPIPGARPDAGSTFSAINNVADGSRRSASLLRSSSSVARIEYD